ncbi:MAG: ABC transporter permease [Rhizobium sp.]
MFSSNIVQLAIKELRSLLRDPVMLILILFSFTVSVYTNATSAPETLNRASIAIVDEDQSPLSGRIATSFYPPYFMPPQTITVSQMDRRMDNGLDTFALDIPPNFQRDLLSGKSPVIQLNVDATRTSQAFTGGGYIQSIVSGEVSEFLQRYRTNAAPQIDLSLRSRFNPELNKGWVNALNGIINNITMLSIILAGAALIREREHGTIEHLLVMPVTPFEIMVSKIGSMGLVVFVASAFSLLVVVRGLLDIPLYGSLALFFLGAALQLFAATSLGIFLATVAGTMPQFGLLLMLVLLPIQVLSGAMTPRESMPEVVQKIMLVAPDTHFVMLAQAVLFRGAGLNVVWPQLLALLVIGAVLFFFSLRRFRAFLK